MAEGGQSDSSLANDNTFCQPCKDEGELKGAHGYCQNCQEYMCQKCIKSIHRSSNNKGHTILSGKQMPSTPPERHDQCSTEEYSEMCKVHTNEVLKFFCPDHEVFECGVCIVLNHRVCSVQFVPDAAKGFSNASEYKDQRNMLREIQNDIQTCEDKVEERSVSANDVHSVALGDLKKFRKEINEYLDESERDIESSAEHLKARVDEKIEELKNKYIEIKIRADKCEQTLDIASSDEVRLFMTSKRSEKDIGGFKLSVDKLQKTCEQDNMRYEFKPDSVFEKILNLKRSVGKMTITNEIKNDDESDITADELDMDESDQERKLADPIAFAQTPSNISVISYKDVHQACSCGSHKSDCSSNNTKVHLKRVKQYSSCCITGMTVLSPGRLVVADKECHSVKLIDTVKKAVLSRYFTESFPGKAAQPLDVVVHSGHKILCSYTSGIYGCITYNLTLLSCEHDCLQFISRIMVDACPSYISSLDDRIYIRSKCSIEMKNSRENGQFMQTITLQQKSNDETSFAVNKSKGGPHIYVTDQTSWNSYTLRKVTIEGEVVAHYTDWDFTEPGIVTSAGNGNILLYNFGKKELLLMSGNCEKIRCLLRLEESTKDIRAMTFCSETKTLFLSEQEKSTYIKAIKLP